MLYLLYQEYECTRSMNALLLVNIAINYGPKINMYKSLSSRLLISWIIVPVEVWDMYVMFVCTDHLSDGSGPLPPLLVQYPGSEQR